MTPPQYNGKKKIEVRGEGTNHLLFVVEPEKLVIEVKVADRVYEVPLYDLIAVANAENPRTVIYAPPKYANGDGGDL